MILATCLECVGVVALLVWFIAEGFYVVPNLCREWRKAVRTEDKKTGELIIKREGK